jgi:hypothetical protein
MAPHLRVVLYAAVAVAACAPALAGAATPDWSGVWNPHDTPIFDPSALSAPQNQGARSPLQMREFPPYRPDWEAKYEKALAAIHAGRMADPTSGCAPGGIPRILDTPYPFEIVIEPKRVDFLFEINSQVRRIWTDGRPHPADPDPTYVGHSIGHWEGDTLVVDTVGLRDDTVFDITGARHSAALHVIERIHRLSPDRLEDQITVEDPVAFTGPWRVTRSYDLKKDWEIKEYVCEENNRNPIAADGSTGFVRPAEPLQSNARPKP